MYAETKWSNFSLEINHIISELIGQITLHSLPNLTTVSLSLNDEAESYIHLLQGIYSDIAVCNCINYDAIRDFRLFMNTHGRKFSQVSASEISMFLRIHKLASL